MEWWKICDKLATAQFTRWLVNEKIMQRLTILRGRRAHTIKSTTTLWIEKLLQTPLDDYRKFVVWRILALYLITMENVLLMRLLIYKKLA